MKLSKKKLKKINFVSFINEVVEEYTPTSEKYYGIFLRQAPDQWSEEETRLFDMLTELEDRTKKEIVRIIEGKNNGS